MAILLFTDDEVDEYLSTYRHAVCQENRNRVHAAVLSIDTYVNDNIYRWLNDRIAEDNGGVGLLEEKCEEADGDCSICDKHDDEEGECCG